MESDSSTYIIIGAGVFGASTALTLIRRYPSAHVTLIDRAVPHQFTASWDWSKVIRADYADIVYTRLALEAKAFWREDPLYREFYHETGLIWVDDGSDKGFLDKVTANFSTLKADERWRMVPVPELRDAHDSIFKNAYFGGEDQIYVNYSSGWVDASKAMRGMLDAAIEAGVEFKEASVSHLLFDGSKDCTGVRLNDGQIMSAKRIILAASAETARILAESAPKNPEIHAASRLSAAGLITAFSRLKPENAARYRAAPVFLYANGPWQGAVIPPNTESQLKISRDISTMNTVEILPGQYMSLPPQNPKLVHSNLLTTMEKELAIVSEHILGEPGLTLDFEDCCLCWDAITPTQDFIISGHPHSKNLFIASGGSFHSWKFLPILGNYVMQMLEGTLTPELANRWAWDRDERDMVNKRMAVSRELSDILS